MAHADCDKGSLLVCKLLLGGMGDACRVELVLEQSR